MRISDWSSDVCSSDLYVLDEPSIGLHQRDNERLLETLRRLRDLGNSVIVVEHDEDAIRSADYLVDMGPRAGVNGGQVIAIGLPEEVMRNPESLTGQYLTGLRQIEVPRIRREGHPGQAISILGAMENNRQKADAANPTGTLTPLTGRPRN